MLPTPSDNGARLAAILPTGLAALAPTLGHDASEVLARAMGDMPTDPLHGELSRLPELRSLLLIVVDGLGYANLKARAGHARTLRSLPTRRIDTVIPSTTGAALTTITTGRLPGTHGLIGYRIRHPEAGLVTTLKDWGEITDRAAWQRADPLFLLGRELGLRTEVIGRPAHEHGGLTEAILRGAEYHGGQTIAERFSIASQLLRRGEPMLGYLYVDELDRVAHSDGWQSDRWLQRLEQLDDALQALLVSLPAHVGVIVTADHGMIDVPPERRVLFDRDQLPFEGVAEIGGEPRMRSLYLQNGADPQECAARLGAALGKRAWVGTREEAIAANWFGETDSAVANRLGEVLVTPRSLQAYMLSSDSQQSHEMVGQHGGLSEDERGVPLALAGALDGSSFVAAVSRAAAGAARG